MSLPLFIILVQGDIWIDGIYIRHITDGKAKPRGGKTSIQQNMWMTRSTFQSSGMGEEPCDDCENWPDVGLLVLGNLYAQGTTRLPTTS